MKNITSTALITTLCMFPTLTRAQNEIGDLLCSELMPALLTMVDNVEDIPTNFEAVYGSMSASDRQRFAAVKGGGEDFAEAAKAYRAAFLEACFGN